MAGKTGVVDASVPGLADAARVPLADCEEALRRLQAPDPYSRSGDHDGRRIEPVDGGWRLINHAKYREKMNLDERRAYLAAKQREFRRQHKRQHVSTNVTIRNGPLTRSTHASPSSSPSPSSEGSSYISADPEQNSGSTPPVLTFPVVGVNGRSWVLTADHLSRWVSAYPTLEVLAECRKALAWVEATGRRKTARGMPRFLVGWLNRTADRSSRSSVSSTPLLGKQTTRLLAAVAQLRHD